jgi:hypothetical protein
MSTTDESDTPGARFHFRSWTRRGVGADAGPVDGPGLPARASLDVTLNVTALQGLDVVLDTPAPTMTVHLYGPGDVIGVSPLHVIRTEPRDQTMNFEPTYLAGIEFDHPDFPWLFTPAQPDADRLRPFVALIALKDGEFTVPPGAPNPLPAIDVTAISALQTLDDAWNWAHTQVSGDTDLTTVMASNPAAAISRVLCPRRLDPETTYTAFLVPAFENGRQAGLGADVSAITTSDPAWTSQTAAPLRLPVLYRFSFTTSDAGDFESLVRRLKPTVLPAEVGSTPMAVDRPATGVPSAGGPLGLEGALRSVETTPTSWTGADHDAFQSAVQNLVNLNAVSPLDDPDNPAPDDPRIVPPMYGQWHAAATSVDRTQPGWLGGLNLDPRNRAGAGMGTQIVQNQRTALMASAWDQVAGVEAANELLRAAQLSRAAMGSLWASQLHIATPSTLLALTAPVHARMLASPRTVYATLTDSRVPQRMVSGAYRRVMRPLGPLGRRVDALAGVTAPPAARTPLIERINSDELRVAPPPPPPGAMTSIDGVSDAVENRQLPAWLPGWLRRLIVWLAAHGLLGWLLFALALVLAAVLAVAVIVAGLPVAAIAGAVAVAVGLLGAAVAAVRGLAKMDAIDSASESMRWSQLSGPAIADAAPASGFAVSTPPSGLGGHGTLISGPVSVSPPVPPPAAASGADSPDAARFRVAAADLLTFAHAAPTDAPLAAALDLTTLAGTVLSRLDPAKTMPARMGALVRMPGGQPWFAPDPIEPIMAAPTFPQPMYAPLRDLNQDYLLPGVELIPPDTLGAVVSNHIFIESYMVGLNHEMARQLLWNGYPGDQRGSYFRQFWDVSGYLPQAGDPTDPAQLAEALKDIPPINTWPRSRPLGQNENRGNTAVDDIVLLVRGELLRRYPNTVIFAGKATAGAGGDDGRVLDETVELFPIFHGTLQPDLTFFGFNLSVDDARGGTAASPLGYFFVFQEQPTEPRFGLEPDTTGPVKRWEDLAWTNFAEPSSGTQASTPASAPSVAPSPAPTPVSAPMSTPIPEPESAQRTLPSSAVSSVFPSLHPTEISRYRVASTVFAEVLLATRLPDFLTAGHLPSGVALDGSNPEDPALAWGRDSAQTAAITLRMPFRILIHADSLLPPRQP